MSLDGIDAARADAAAHHPCTFETAMIEGVGEGAATRPIVEATKQWLDPASQLGAEERFTAPDRRRLPRSA